MGKKGSLAISAIKLWRPVIGLELHAQLQTKTKMFSMAAFNDDAEVNDSVSQFDMAAPGTLPVLSRAAVMLGLKAGLLLHCTIPSKNRFERKHYFYADMPAGYQITQQRNPIAHSGYFDFYVHSDKNEFVSYSKRLRIARIQLEIDSGKTLHDLDNSRSLIDLNRAGVGLIEIVSEPELTSALEGQCFAEQLLMLLCHNSVCGGQMHRGQFRVDANVSLTRAGSSTLGVRTEVKNLNSFSMVYAAINYEIARQYEILNNGGSVINETRTIDSNGKTLPMRDKEVETDYRFLPEPNLPSVVIQKDWLFDIQTTIDMMPDYMSFIKDYGMDPKDALPIARNKRLSDFTKKVLKICESPVSGVLQWLNELEFICCKCNVNYPPQKSGFVEYFASAISMQNSRLITKYTAIDLLRKRLEDKIHVDFEMAVGNDDLWRITDSNKISTLLKMVFEQHRTVVEKALKNPKPKSINKLRNELIVTSGKRIDLIDANNFVTDMLENLKRKT